MRKKAIYIIIIVMLVVAMFIATIIYNNNHSVEVKENSFTQSGLIKQSVFGTEMKYMLTVNDEEDAYFGYDCYEDTEYRYFVEPATELLVGIEAIDINFSNEAIDISIIKEKANDIFNKCMGEFITGEVSEVIYEFDGVEYPVEYIEIYDGYETGTKALILMGQDGSLYSAAFVKGSVYYFYPEKMLKEKDAVEKAVKYIQGSFGDMWYIEDELDKTAQIRTINNQTIWYFILPMEDKTTKEIRYFLVSMDVYSGELVNIDICM